MEFWLDPAADCACLYLIVGQFQSGLVPSLSYALPARSPGLLDMLLDATTGSSPSGPDRPPYAQGAWHSEPLLAGFLRARAVGRGQERPLMPLSKPGFCAHPACLADRARNIMECGWPWIGEGGSRTAFGRAVTGG